eukprot:SAG11_NODE_37777_length_255_cov_0.730769_1_plen_58_part_10
MLRRPVRHQKHFWCQQSDLTDIELSHQPKLTGGANFFGIYAVHRNSVKDRLFYTANTL